MNERNLILIVLGIHLISVTLYFLIHSLTGKCHLRREQILPILLIPLAGLLIALGNEMVHMVGRSSKKQVDIDTMHLGSDLYWRSLQEPHESLDIVPLEEAINLDSYGVRRRILLDTLFDEPEKHLQVLMVARQNDDAETAHYAATTVEKIQRDYQLELQNFSTQLEKRPNDRNVLIGYIRLLEEYIHSGLPEEHLMERQRVVLSELLEKKLSLEPRDKQVLIKKLHNSLAMEAFSTAMEVSEILRKEWPNDEDTWIESLRLSVEAGNQELFQEVTKEIKNADIEWSKSSRDKLAYWMDGYSFE